jgi:hypothetical protein
MDIQPPTGSRDVDPNHLSTAGIDWSRLGGLVVMFTLAVWLWHRPVMFPIKMFVVLLHEISHGLVAALTGGQIEGITISMDLGGLCTFRGGWDLLVLPAGYIGSLLWGGLILVGSARTRHDRAISMAIGIGVLAVTILYVHNGFGIVFCVLFGAAMIALGRFATDWLNDAALQFLGLTSCLYALIDIKEDLIDRTVPGSDAWQMAQKLWLPAFFWGVLWIVIALVCTAMIVRSAVRVQDEPEHGSDDS